MQRKFILGMICCALTLGGCAANNTRSLKQDEVATVETLKGAILDRADLSADERTAFGFALDNFGQYLLRRFGESKLKQCNERIRQSSDTYESLNKTYETNPIFLWQEFGRRQAPNGHAVGTDWLTSASDHFIFQFHPESAAERDIEVIKREAENALGGACAELGFSLEQLETKLDSLMEMRDSGSGAYYVSQGKGESETWVRTDGRIPVILTEDWEEYRELGGRKYTSGFCRFGPGPIGAPRSFYYVRLVYVYFDAFQLLTLTHEIVHAVHFLAPSAEPAVWSEHLKRRIESEAKPIVIEANEFIELAHPVNNDKYLAEGLATWYCVHHGLVPKATGIPPLHRMVADIMPAWKNVDLRKIIDWRSSLSFHEKAMTVLGKEKYVKREQAILYLGAGCFIEYISAEIDPDKLHLLMSRTEGNASDRIIGVFGMDPGEMDLRWKRWIMNPAGKPLSAHGACREMHGLGELDEGRDFADAIHDR